MSHEHWRSFDVLGVRVDAVEIEDLAVQIEKWAHEAGQRRTVAATSMHGIVEAQRDPSFKDVLNSMDAVAPDGMPLIWLGRGAGHQLPRRAYGPDLMLEVCRRTAGRGYRHFLYGGEPGVPEQLAESLKRRFPLLNLCGTFSPPFGALAPEESRAVTAMISHAAPDILWVGLGTPKQERWMHEYAGSLPVAVLVSVGAAFDILSGRRRQAPVWMRERGLECFFRLLQEPRRLWKRYLVYGTYFIGYLALERLRERDL